MHGILLCHATHHQHSSTESSPCWNRRKKRKMLLSAFLAKTSSINGEEMLSERMGRKRSRGKYISQRKGGVVGLDRLDFNPELANSHSTPQNESLGFQILDSSLF